MWFIDDFFGIQTLRRLEIGNSFFDVRPGRILRQYCPNHDLEWAVARPPVLLTIVFEQSLIYLLDGYRRRDVFFLESVLLRTTLPPGQAEERFFLAGL